MTDANMVFRPIDRAQHTVLVVDDDPVSRYTTLRWLRNAGFKTREAANGEEGLRLADADISAMVLDVHLPDIEGFEVCRRLRLQSATARLPVLHLSAAYIADEDKVKGLDLGADSYLTHPVEPAVLVASIQALVRARVAEDAMRKSEAQFRAIYARAPGGICLLDDAGRIADANPAMLKFLGCELHEVVGRLLMEFVPDAAAESARGFIAAARQGVSRAEFPLHSSRRVGPLLARWTLLPDIQSGLHMALATDISARNALEHQRRQAFQREREARSSAERLSRMKDEFIAVLSHELRTPLTAIRGWVHVLRKRPDDVDVRDRGLEAIERNVALQSRLISDLLDMSSINLGKMRLALGDVDVADVMQGAVDALAPVIEAKRLDVQIRVDVPHTKLRADAARLQQVVANLLGNAVKFSEQAGQIHLDVRPQGDGIELVIADQGKGIAPDFLPLLFERFSQADAGSNRRHGGLGLGLSIVRHLVESHDGNVRVTSAGLGQGATFTVWLPTQGPALDASEASHEGDELVSSFNDPESTLAGTSLLVVDDDPDICAMLQFLLGDRGASVRVAHDYESALASLEESKPDLLLSDVGMPGEDGYALIREVRRRERAGQHLPAIALTSYARSEDREQAIAEGFDLHSPKPVRPLQLVREIRRLIRK